MRAALLALLLAAVPAAAQVPPPPVQKIVTAVDPLTIELDDFRRLADPEIWRDLQVRRIEFREGRTFWRLYRIANTRRPDGPLWLVPHDNENAAFQAAVYAARSYGGVVMAVEEARSLAGPDSRGNGDVAAGGDVDPNRNFRPDTPDFAGAMLADLGNPARLSVALHTNDPGYDAAGSSCLPPESGEETGKGTISVLLCNDLYMPRRSIAGRWPFDDTDSVAIVSYLGERSPFSGFCARPLSDADFNIMFEHVVTSDGSASNFAVFRGLPYVNLETQERGVAPDQLGEARSRLLAMIDTVMARCAVIPRLSLDLPEPHERPRRRRGR
ncbi:hypothetical protein [Sphingomonas aracearum]|uniref:N-acetylmuramoyl-L-alanine amidase n=1 Tax=Sphingomonas aracearum TaxID=2283317 RepID=A0A369VVC9_9SPHN|nr:hypothetical protein [Sphingomonas aracearum]RDE05130.1 hypothetical protein DVW87_07550 [Sphingomonas aracearum]